MLRKFVLAAVAAASLGGGVATLATPASAHSWDGPRYGYDRGYGPPPWVVRKWLWRRHHNHHHFGPPAYYGPRERYFSDRPGPYRPHW
jgi:hypothetical protein